MGCLATRSAFLLPSAGLRQSTVRLINDFPTPVAPGRLRLALVCDWYRPRLGGIERHLEQLAAQLAEAGHDVTVITPTRGEIVNSGPVRVHRLRAALLPWIKLAWTPAAYRRLGEAIREGRFDVVHAHASMISPMAYAAVYHAQAAGLPAVLTLHSIWGGFRRVGALLDRVMKWTRWPVIFSAVSARAARDLQALLPKGKTVESLPNAIVPDEWRVAVAPFGDTVNVACVMRLAPRKRGSALLIAVREVRRQLPPGLQLKFRIAGDGPERGKLEWWARRLGVDDCIQFVGATDTEGVKALLATSHFFVLPTELEAFGLAALEARAAGLPIVAMRSGGVGEWLENEKEGLLADDDAGLANCILRLATDPVLRQTMADHNRSTPVAFTWERTLRAHLDVYARAKGLIA